MKVYLLLLSLSCFFILSTSRPDGAPKSSCSLLKPVHNGIAAQRTSPPYTVEVERRRGNSFRITIKSPLNEEFQGFIVQARSYNDKTRFIDGEFKPRSNNAKTIDCFNREKSTLTQIDANPKTEIVADWYSRVATDERIIFRATVAKSFAVFWTEIDSNVVTVKSAKQMVTKQLSSSERPNNLYEDCFTDKGCFGLPEGCVQNTDCEVLFTYSKSPEGLHYSMHGTLDPKMYMAMGLSHDNLMGDDKVTECIRVDSNDIILRESYNEGKRNSRTNEIPRDGYISLHENGISSCYWTSPYEIEDNGKHYDFKKHAYYILLAKGSVENGRLRYHDDRIASAQSVNFTAFLAVAGENVADSIKIHGTFMVTAWVGFVSIAILLARHFKNTWENSTLGGVKIWFALHRLFMVTALVFFSIAFIVIFIYKNGWNYQTSNPHAILGCIAVALGILNPIMALFRPAPDSKKRPIFNWLHWSVGNAAHIIAIITIFFAVSLPSSGLKNSFYWVMAVFVIVHLIFHLLYQAHIWTQTAKKNNDLSMNEMNGARSNAHNGQNAQAKNVSANVFRILLLGIYSVFLFVILIALYALIGVA